MHVAYYGNFAESWETESYIARALERAGCQVTRIQERETVQQLLDQLPEADVFLFAKARFGGLWSSKKFCQMLPNVRRKCKRTVCWIFDLLNPDYSTERFQWASVVSAECDLFCTTDGSTAPYLFNCKVLRQGIGDDVRPGVYRPDLACDILFLGEAYGERAKFVEILQQHFNRRFWYVPTGYRGDILNDLMASAKIVIGPPWPAFPGYWSNRIYCVAGYGGAFVAPDGEDTEHELTSGYYDANNAISELELWLEKDKSIIEENRMFAQHIAKKRHTYDQRAAQLLEWLS